MFIKQFLHVKRNCSMQSVKQHNNRRKVSNAASITTGIRLDKILAVSVISHILRPMRAMSDRKIQTNNVEQVKPFTLN